VPRKLVGLNEALGQSRWFFVTKGAELSSKNKYAYLTESWMGSTLKGTSEPNMTNWMDTDVKGKSSRSRVGRKRTTRLVSYSHLQARWTRLTAHHEARTVRVYVP
jgi:hypothetical protein